MAEETEKTAVEDGSKPGRKAAATVLSEPAFDEFRAMLDGPMPKAMQDLLARKAIWR